MEISKSTADQLSLDIINILKGLPLSKALHVLGATKAYLLDFHTVDPENPRFVEERAKLEAFIKDPSLRERCSSSYALIN